MTTNRRAKKQARTMQADSGLTYTEARRSSGLSWDAGTTPWARGIDSTDRPRRLYCYFCGEKTAILSFGDIDDDHGRLELYCDNGSCDARETTVLVMRDGQDALRRADVGALNEIDTPRMTRPKVMGLQELIDSAPSATELVARRQRGPGQYAASSMSS